MSLLSWIFKGSAPNDKTGTPARQAADIINNNFANLDNRIVDLENPDGVLKSGEIETDGLNVDVVADAFEWQIDQVKFLDNPAYHAVLDAATDGYYRKDVLLGNDTGSYNIFKGDEDPTSATAPSLFPVGTINLGVIDVYGAVITGSIPVDISGKEDKANKNQPNGYAGLDGAGKIYNSQLPALNSDNVAEGAVNKYSTLALVMSYVLTGISFGTGTPITATDTILSAFGKLQRQIDDLLSNVLTIGTDQTVSGVKTFLAGKFALRNGANTFSSFFTNANTASRTWTLPDKNGTVAMTSDIPTNTVATGTQNFLSKYNNAGGTQIGNSRILDTGSFIGIETVNAPTKDITFGYIANREIGVEQSNNVTVGKDLILSAGRTINYIDNSTFVALTPIFGFPSYGMCSTPSGNIYIVAATGFLYKQTGGSGSFVSLGVLFPGQARAICSNASNDLYVAINNGDIYKQTNETGAFVALGQTSRAWTGLARFGSDIYASVFGGDIYKQTGGTGNFVALGQTVRNWGRMSSSSSAIYVAVAGSGIYKQVGGAGNFVLHSSQANSGGITVSNSNDLFVNSGTDIYKQTNESGAFVATGSAVTNNGIWGMATHANGNIYAGDFSNTVFMMLNNGAGYSDLKGGNLKLKSGTAKGTGLNRVEIYTGQKTVSGTDMQVETLRAYYDENGNFVYLSIPTYANDAAADADVNLPSKGYYKLTGNRTVFQKP